MKALCPYCEDAYLDDTGICPACDSKFCFCSKCGKPLDPDYTYPVQVALHNSDYDIYDKVPYCRECYLKEQS